MHRRTDIGATGAALFTKLPPPKQIGVSSMNDVWQEVSDWTAAYDNRGAVPAHEQYFDDWQKSAASYRSENPPESIAYGEGLREKLDLFRPAHTPKGLLIFIHGGWWMNFGRETFSHLAKGAVEQGWAVAMPSYSLCPDIRISGICDQVARAVTVACEHVPEGPIVLSGHSAGGHLASYLGTVESKLCNQADDRLQRIVAISPISDLHPLMQIDANEQLGIDCEEAPIASPALLRPRGGFDCLVWCGADELPEFRRQTAMLATAWGADIHTRRIEAAGRNHFDVIAPLQEADSDLARAVTLREADRDAGATPEVQPELN